MHFLFHKRTPAIPYQDGHANILYHIALKNSNRLIRMNPILPP